MLQCAQTFTEDLSRGKKCYAMHYSCLKEDVDSRVRMYKQKLKTSVESRRMEVAQHSYLKRCLFRCTYNVD